MIYAYEIKYCLISTLVLHVHACKTSNDFKLLIHSPHSQEDAEVICIIEYIVSISTYLQLLSVSPQVTGVKGFTP